MIKNKKIKQNKIKKSNKRIQKRKLQIKIKAQHNNNKNL